MAAKDAGAALAALKDEIVRDTLSLIKQYKDPDVPDRLKPALIKQAVDTPHRAKARLQEWMKVYDAGSRQQTAQEFLQSALQAAGAAKSLSDINSEVNALVEQTETIVQRVANDKWTWDQVADAIEEALSPEPEVKFSYRDLPLPQDYKTIWGDFFRRG